MSVHVCVLDVIWGWRGSLMSLWDEQEGGGRLASPSLERRASPRPGFSIGAAVPERQRPSQVSGTHPVPAGGAAAPRSWQLPGQRARCPPPHPLTWHRPRRPRPTRASSRRRGWASPSRAPQVREGGRRASEACSARPPRAPPPQRRGRRRGQQAGCGLGSGAALGVLQGAKINPAKDQVSRPK